MAAAFPPSVSAMAPYSSPPVQLWWQPSFPAVPSYFPVSGPPVASSSSQPLSTPIPAVSPVPSPSQPPASPPATSMRLGHAEAPLSSASVPSPPPSSLSPTKSSPPPSSLIPSLKPPELSPFIPAISPLLPPLLPKLPIDSPSTLSVPPPESPLGAPNPSVHSPLPSPPLIMPTRNLPPPSPSPQLPMISDSPPQSAHSHPVHSPTENPQPHVNVLPPPIVSLPPAISPSISSPKTPSAILKKAPPPSFSASPSSSPYPKPLPSLVTPMARHSNHSAAESSGNGVNKTVLAATISMAAGFLALFFVAIIWVLMKRKRRTSASSADNNTWQSPLGSSAKSDTPIVKATDSSTVIRNDSIINFMYVPPESGRLGNSRSLFAYEELWRATNGFADQNFLGEGGFGSVYKGCLQDGREVAVKHLKIGGGQGEREFKAEVEIISRVHHRHLVTLVGYCISENKRLLIYDYVPNNNLYFHLHEKNMPDMDWATRIKVAAGAARGIAYLHEDCHPRIIHRDIKSSNILLDNSFDAQVSDFGLAKLALDSNSHVSTRVVGTFGYMAPEYASSGKLSEKSDVYSFGVVLLELITGRKPVDSSQPSGAESLVEWARPLLIHALENREFENLVDPILGNNYVRSEMLHMIEAAAACVRHLAAKRPQMGQIVRAIDNITYDLTNGMRLGESEVYDSALQSGEIRLIQRMAFGNQNYTVDFF